MRLRVPFLFPVKPETGVMIVPGPDANSVESPSTLSALSLFA
jgi:hypothetical protein